MNVAEAFVVVAKGGNQSKGTVNKTSMFFNLFGALLLYREVRNMRVYIKRNESVTTRLY
jgi:hypothetical protein